MPQTWASAPGLTFRPEGLDPRPGLLEHVIRVPERLVAPPRRPLTPEPHRRSATPQARRRRSSSNLAISERARSAPSRARLAARRSWAARSCCPSFSHCCACLSARPALRSSTSAVCMKTWNTRSGSGFELVSDPGFILSTHHRTSSLCGETRLAMIGQIGRERLLVERNPLPAASHRGRAMSNLTRTAQDGLGSLRNRLRNRLRR